MWVSLSFVALGGTRSVGDYEILGVKMSNGLGLSVVRRREKREEKAS